MTMKDLRTIHFYLSLAVSPTLLLFAAGSVPIAHHFLNPASTIEQVRDFTIPGGWLEANAIAAFLADEYDVHGSLGGVQGSADGLRFSLSRIGQYHEVHIAPLVPGASGRAAKVVTHTQSLSGFLIALHTEVGIRDGSFAGKLWRTLLGAIAAAMLGIVLTGALLWWRRPRRQRPGQRLLVFSLSLGTLLLVIVRLG